jgi:hypothetical protein
MRSPRPSRADVAERAANQRLAALLEKRFPRATNIHLGSAIHESAFSPLATIFIRVDGENPLLVDGFVKDSSPANDALKQVCQFLIEKLRKADPSRQVEFSDLQVCFPDHGPAGVHWVTGAEQLVEPTKLPLR